MSSSVPHSGTSRWSTQGLSDTYVITLHEEEVHTLLEHLPPHQPGQTTWTAIDLQGFTSDQKEIYKCLEDNQKKVLTYLHRPIRKILNLSSRGVSAEDDGNNPRGQG